MYAACVASSPFAALCPPWNAIDRKSTRLNSSHLVISYAVFCLKKKNNNHTQLTASDLFGIDGSTHSSFRFGISRCARYVLRLCGHPASTPCALPHSLPSLLPPD